MSAKERAEDLEKYIQKELAALMDKLSDQDAVQLTEETRTELANIYGAELVNRLFGKRDFTTLPELNALATSSLKTKALLLAELKIWERLMSQTLADKNQAANEIAEKFKGKTAQLYEELTDTAGRRANRFLSEMENSHKQLIELLEDETRQVQELHQKGEELRSSSNYEQAIKEHTKQINGIIKQAIEKRVDELIKDAPYDEYRRKEFIINKEYCLAHFIFGGSLVAAGFTFMKLF